MERGPQRREGGGEGQPHPKAVFKKVGRRFPLHSELKKRPKTKKFEMGVCLKKILYGSSARALCPPDGGGAISKGGAGVSPAAASAAPLYNFYIKTDFPASFLYFSWLLHASRFTISTPCLASWRDAGDARNHSFFI